MGALLLLSPLLMYFFPAIVAGIRHHRNAAAITMLNLFLGWTLIGWVISLVWAFANSSQPQVVYLRSNEANWRNVTGSVPMPVPTARNLSVRS